MSEVGLFWISAVLLLATIAIGLRRWDNARAAAAGLTRWEIRLAAATTVGGLIGAPFWWLDLPPSFAWDLPPLASRMLACAALAFAVAGMLVLERPERSTYRFFAAATLLYLAPLGIAIVMLHLDRFDAMRPVTWGFFAVVTVLSSGYAMSLAGRPGAMPDAAWQGPVTIVAGAALVAWGAAMFAWPAAPLPLLFNWPADPLTSRLIATMIVTVGFALLAAARTPELRRVAMPFAAIYGCGVLLACGLNAMAGRPYPVAYAAILGAVGLFCAIRAASERRAWRSRVAG